MIGFTKVWTDLSSAILCDLSSWNFKVYPEQSTEIRTVYRVYYTDQPKLPLTTWQVKLLSVDHALGSPSPYEVPTADADAYRPPSHLTLITHLRSNATYYIRISASNAKGDGPPSAPYAVIVRPGVLPPPVNLQAISKSAHEISLTWEMPESKPDQPPLVKYELTSTAFDTTSQTSTSHQSYIEPSSSSHLVSGLLPDTRYRFRLAAVSEAGAGLPAEVNAKTKEYGR
ncbi:unnamed protein product [Schistocephalus solidus]|uniref:Fibronectin type-III domain-containing protein n=1 Tax=Schistocephalus solidus TaxID=70667 RepID=A0A183TSS1_SCHSO|nr:unnamed protein product [Schistocephalus solidus]